MYAPFPIADDSQRDPQADADVEWMKAFIVGIRNIRGEMQLPPSKLLAVLCKNADARTPPLH